MKLKLTFLLLITFTNMYTQDVILVKDGVSINARVKEIGTEEIKYYKFENLEGPVYSIHKSEVAVINFENGTSELINSEIKNKMPISIEETKNAILETINAFGYKFSKGSLKKRYSASFEGDYLRLIMLNKKGIEVDRGILFDFSNVYKFRKGDKRKNNVTHLNIWAAIIDENKNKVIEKYHLLMTVNGHDNAELLLDALKYYNKLMLEKKGPANKFKLNK